MRYVARYLTLVGMLATAAWFFWNPEGWVLKWEPIVVFLFALAGFITTDVTESHLNDQSTLTVNPHDTALFQKLINLLPSDGPIKFIRQHDFLIDFDNNELSPFYEYRRNWDNAEHEFVDKELERLNQGLYDAVNRFADSIARYTSPNNSGFQAVRHDHHKHDPEYEERFRREAKAINSAADTVISWHQKMIREGKRRLIKYTSNQYPQNDATEPHA